jgi:hypothetical protein
MVRANWAARVQIEVGMPASTRKNASGRLNCDMGDSAAAIEYTIAPMITNNPCIMGSQIMGMGCMVSSVGCKIKALLFHT